MHLQPIKLAEYACHRLIEVDFVWRHLLNYRPTREFNSYQPASFSEEAERILAELNQSGVAISHVDEFAGMAASFKKLKDSADRVEALRLQNAHRASPRGGQPKSLPYNANLLGSYPRLNPESIFAEFAIQQPLLDILIAYFGMFIQLRKYAIYRNVSRTHGVNSKWHRDGVCDAMILRLFVYFEDVSAENGAFTYAKNTHSKSAEGSRRVISDQELDQRAVLCSGPAGTIVLADTRGYHRANSFAKGDRWLYNSMYTSPGYGADYFNRKTSDDGAKQRGMAESWALADPMTIRKNLVG